MDNKDKQKTYSVSGQNAQNILHAKLSKINSIDKDLSTRAEAEVTEGFTSQAPSNGGHSLSLQDSFIAIEISNGSKNGETTLAVKQRVAGNVYGVSSSTFDGKAISKALEDRKAALEKIDDMLDSDNTLAKYNTKPSSKFKSNDEYIQWKYSGTIKYKARLALCKTQEDYDRLNADRRAGLFDNPVDTSRERVATTQAVVDSLEASGGDQFKLSPDVLTSTENQMLEMAQKAVMESNRVLGNGMLKAINGSMAGLNAVQQCISGTLTVEQAQQMLTNAAEDVGSGVGEMLGGAIFGDNPGLAGQIGIKVISFVGKWLLSKRSLFELVTEALSDWWDKFNVIDTVVDAVGKLTGLPSDVVKKVSNYAKIVWKNGADPATIFKALDSLKVDGKDIKDPQISFNFDTSNIGAMIRAVFSAGLAPLQFVDNIMAKIESIVTSPILYMALTAWALIKPNTGASTVLDISLTIARVVVWLRSKLCTIMTAINNVADQIVKLVDDLIKKALEWLLDIANVGLSYLKPVLALVPIDSSVILRTVLSMFSLNHVVEITYKAPGITESDLAKCGIGNQKTNRQLEEQGKEPTSNTQQGVSGDTPTPNKPKDIKSAVNLAIDSKGKPRTLNLEPLAEWYNARPV